MEVQLLIVGALAIGNLARKRNEGRRRKVKAGEEREAKILAAAAANQAAEPYPGSQGLPPLSQGLLLLAAAIDVTLWYFVYRALVSDEGWKSQPKSVWIAAAASAFISVLYLFHLLTHQGSRGRAAGSGVTWNPSQAASAHRLQDMTGTWMKDGKASSSMEEAIHLMHLSRLTRTAVKLIKGIQIVQTAEKFDLAVFSVISWFKIRESYPMNGEVRQEKRRDLRRGKHRGRLRVDRDGDLCLHLEWDDPFGGSGHDKFCLVSPTELHAHSHLNVGGNSADYVTVYRKQ